MSFFIFFSFDLCCDSRNAGDVFAVVMVLLVSSSLFLLLLLLLCSHTHIALVCGASNGASGGMFLVLLLLIWIACRFVWLRVSSVVSMWW